VNLEIDERDLDDRADLYFEIYSIYLFNKTSVWELWKVQWLFKSVHEVNKISLVQE